MEANPTPLSRSALRLYAGQYGDRDIPVREGTLSYRRGRRPEQPLVALGDDLFAFQKSATRIQFDRDSKGKVAAITLLSVRGSASSYARTEK